MGNKKGDTSYILEVVEMQTCWCFKQVLRLLG